MSKCPYCPNDATIPGRACEQCCADFDQAIDDLWDELEKVTVPQRARVYKVVGRLFGEK